MNTEQYIKEILKKVDVNRKTRRRLREDLTEAVEARLAAGENLKEIITAMGEPTAVAAEIQENYPSRRRTKPELGLLAATLAAGGWFVVSGISAINQLLQQLAIKMLPDNAMVLYSYTMRDMPGSNYASSMGIIGGADGPTTIYTTTLFMPAQYAPLVLSLLIAVACGLAYWLLRRRKQA